MPYGYDDSFWAAAKQEAKALLTERACAPGPEGTMPYSELAAKIDAIRFEPHEVRFFHFLGEISEEEDRAGRGMMTVLVVHKSGDMRPGPGFFELAQRLGRDVTDIDKCWVAEFNKVRAAWRDR